MGRDFLFALRLHVAIRASQLALAFVLLISLLWPLAPAFAARLGGAYYVILELICGERRSHQRLQSGLRLQFGAAEELNALGGISLTAY
jgi:hypothetical protein